MRRRRVCLGLAPTLAELRMIEAFGAIQPYTRTLLQDETDFAYFDGHRSGSSHAWRLAGMEGEPPGWETDDEEAERNADPAMEGDLEDIETRVQKATGFVPEQLETLERELIVEARAVWEAFTGFCEEELGFAPETLLKAYFEPMLEEVEELKALVSRLDVPGPDPGALNEYREAMSSTWTTLLRSVGE
jgi:hypothetical protein